MEVVGGFDVLFFLWNSEGEAVGVESFVLVYFRLAEYFQANFILTVVYLYEASCTLEYSGPIYSFSIFLRMPNLVL